MTPNDLKDQLLKLRGITDPAAREAFLSPKYDMLHDPLLMHDMDKAVARIFEAIEKDEKICVYSDYDADGIPGGVILHDFFKKIGYTNFCNYIPHRHDEGYGVHPAALSQLARDGVRLVITVDVGITAVDEVRQGNELGLDIIVTDHHEPIEEVRRQKSEDRKLKLPPAYAIVNPKLGNYPDPMLCGAGVAFKLVQALISKSRVAKIPSYVGGVADGLEAGVVPIGWEKWLLDMAGLATLSDMVPLVNENRIIAYFGMKVLQKNQRPGLRALFEKSGISLDYLVEDDITFSITPKLNAAGRMAHPIDAFNALAEQDPRKAMIAAEHLSALNDERKKIVARIMKDVHKKVGARRTNGDIKSILVIGDPSWPAGILGLIASKVIEEYSVTTFVWGADDEVIKGSARGVGDVSVVQLMQSCTHLLTQFGGHTDAGGFSTTREYIHFLEEEFCKSYAEVRRQKSEDSPESNNQKAKSTFDLELELHDVTIQNYRALRELAPFGVGNLKPVFCFRNVEVTSVRQFGKTMEHLEVMFGTPSVRGGDVRSTTGGVSKIKAISWFATAESFSEKLEPGKTVTLLGEFDFSVFRGKSELRLKIVDILKAQE